MDVKLDEKAKTVATNIRKIREFRNYTQEYLAAKLKISQNAYSRIELGYTRLTLERFFHIAIILEIDELELLKSDARYGVRLHTEEKVNDYRSSYS